MRWRIDYVNDEPITEPADSSVDRIDATRPASPLSEIVEADRFERLGPQIVVTKTVLVIGQPREIVVRRMPRPCSQPRARATPPARPRRRVAAELIADLERIYRRPCRPILAREWRHDSRRALGADPG